MDVFLQLLLSGVLLLVPVMEWTLFSACCCLAVSSCDLTTLLLFLGRLTIAVLCSQLPCHVCLIAHNCLIAHS